MKVLLDQIRGHPATIHVIRSDCHRLIAQDFGRMMEHFHVSCFARAVWVVSRGVVPFLLGMNEAQKHPWYRERCLMGFPVIETDLLPGWLQKDCCLLIDSHYLLTANLDELKAATLLADGTTEVSPLVALY